MALHNRAAPAADSSLSLSNSSSVSETSETSAASSSAPQNSASSLLSPTPSLSPSQNPSPSTLPAAALFLVQVPASLAKNGGEAIKKEKPKFPVKKSWPAHVKFWIHW